MILFQIFVYFFKVPDTTDADGPIPVPQSDFEIEINSSNQDGPTSPGHEITLASTSVASQLEPRVIALHITVDDMYNHIVIEV